MSINLSLLPADEKNNIELDKQAAYLVWQVQQAKVGPDAFLREANKLKTDAERAVFEQAIHKYKQAMKIA